MSLCIQNACLFLSLCFFLSCQPFCSLFSGREKLLASMLSWRCRISYILFQMIYLTVSSPVVSYILYIVHIHFQLLYPKAMPLNSAISFPVCDTVYLSLYLIHAVLHWTNRCGFCDLSAIWTSHTWCAAAYRRWFHKLASHFNQKIQFSPAEQRLFLEHL